MKYLSMLLEQMHKIFLIRTDCLPISFKPKPKLRFAIGYIYISRLPKSNTDLIEESNFYLNFT